MSAAQSAENAARRARPRGSVLPKSSLSKVICHLEGMTGQGRFPPEPTSILRPAVPGLCSAPPMTKRSFSARDLPRLDGKIIAITGANSGIGFEASRALAGAGAHIVMACRSEKAAADAIARLRAEHPSASVEFSALDLSSLASVRAFGQAFASKHERLDVLVNNAGVMALPHRKTEDGFEMQMGTNHLGHFALTGLLMDRLLAAPSPRVVTVSSEVHRIGRVKLDDLQRDNGYSPWPAYGQSKLCNLLFAYELDRRFRERGLSARSLGCHPGYANTNLQLGAAKMTGSTLWQRIWRFINGAFAQSAAMGALPTVFAAAAEEAQGADYIGPWFLGVWGSPVRQRSSGRSRDEAVAKRLWDISEELTGVSYKEALGSRRV